MNQPVSGRWENTPQRVADDYANNMNRDELIKQAICQCECLEESDTARKENDKRISELTNRISELTELFRKSNESMSAMMAVQVSELMKRLKEKDKKISKLQSTFKAGRKNLSGRE